MDSVLSGVKYGGDLFTIIETQSCYSSFQQDFVKL